MEKMFCYQCQEAAKGEGCTMMGVCGKTPVVSKNLDALKLVIKVMAKEVSNNDVSSADMREMDIYITNALFKCITKLTKGQHYFQKSVM